MTRDPIRVEPGVHVRECAERIREHGFRHLPVATDKTPIGILSTRGFTAHIVQDLESFIDQDRYREDLAEGRDSYDHFGDGYER
ncbi:MAG: hypothetical protein CL908_22860 [Deltaproteobacteria bacterium]|nr:hypothetical protein [Deltaproteobacteria bacterium]